MKRYTLVATAALSLVICFVTWYYDPLTPLTQDDTLVIVGLSAILVSTVGLLCRKVFGARSAKLSGQLIVVSSAILRWLSALLATIARRLHRELIAPRSGP